MRESLRCPHCELMQFMTESGNCRRCRQGLVVPDEKPAALPSRLVLLPPPPMIFSQDFSFIGGNVRKLRLERNLTQKDLAFRMCVVRTYISKIESGRTTPTLPLLYRFAKALNIGMGTLVSEPWTTDPFLYEMAPLVASLPESDRTYILNTARDLAQRA